MALGDMTRKRKGKQWVIQRRARKGGLEYLTVEGKFSRHPLEAQLFSSEPDKVPRRAKAIQIS
ncbi:MAG: hypothetical protein P4N41_17995 [Negativicutes bacterium]|nr:hypothetical protein [Negativicutes bacterium]